MNKRALIYIALVMVIAMVAAGCSSVPKKTKAEISGIKTRVDTLESRVGEVETKQTYTERATQEQAAAIEEVKSIKMANTNISTKAKVSKVSAKMKEIQACLKNAGFYNGPVDGIKGRKTRKGIKDFQRANGLVADGLAGRKTWDALSRYASGSNDAGESIK